MPKAPVSVSVLDGKSIKPFVFDIARDTVEVEGQAIPALKFTRRIVQPGDATYELWLRVEDGLPLRSRIGASAKYGAILEQRIQALPPVLR